MTTLLVLLHKFKLILCNKIILSFPSKKNIYYFLIYVLRTLYADFMPKKKINANPKENNDPIFSVKTWTIFFY